MNGDGIINEEAGDCFSCIFAGEDQHIRGAMRYDEDLFKLEYDLFIYDYGDDGIAGDPWIDLSGNDGVYNPGESLSTFSPGAWFDNGLDGLQPNTGDEGEGDGIWQPGDSWVDNGDGVVNAFTDDYINCFDVGNDGFFAGEMNPILKKILMMFGLQLMGYGKKMNKFLTMEMTDTNGIQIMKGGQLAILIRLLTQMVV